MFVKNIVMNPDNPLTIKYYNYKVEFAMRGAAHVHGVLWIDWENIDILPRVSDPRQPRWLRWENPRLGEVNHRPTLIYLL